MNTLFSIIFFHTHIMYLAPSDDMSERQCIVKRALAAKVIKDCDATCKQRLYDDWLNPAIVPALDNWPDFDRLNFSFQPAGGLITAARPVEGTLRPSPEM